MTLVALPDRKYGQSQFPKIQKQIMDLLSDKISPVFGTEGRLSVRMPEFVSVCVKSRIMVDDYDKVSIVEKGLLGQMEKYLDPRHWDIGMLPEETELRNTLFAVPGVLGVKHLEMNLFIGTAPRDRKELFGNPFVLPINGTHQFQIIVRLKND